VTAPTAGQLRLAQDIAGDLVAGVQGNHWGEPTPCDGWSVRDLVGHVVAGNALFVRALGGQYPDPSGQARRDDAELLPAYRDSAAALAEAFGQPGVLGRIVTVPFGTVPGIVALHLRITEILVHGWDLATATGQVAAFPADLAEQELAFSREQLADIPPGRRPFGPPQPVAGDAPAIDRLAALLGRVVTGRSPARR
jgi:uncharacterized protein (TIGR03086 family)